MWFKKKIEVPVDNSTKEIEVLETWIVSWESCSIVSYALTHFEANRMEYVVFIDEREANAFKLSLESASKLLKDRNRKILLEKR